MIGQGGDWSLSALRKQMRPDPRPRRWGDWTESESRVYGNRSEYTGQ